MRYFIKSFIGILLLMFALPLCAQMQITNANTPPFTPENLISNVFLGEGVELISVTYNGVPAAVGYFSNATANIGIERGIVMSSGFANGALGPNDNTGSTTPAGSGNNSTATDADLNQIATSNLNDVAVYEIQFRPFADTLRFRYVFGSEEYMEFACSPYNDVFGFFLSGPGITGPFSNNGKNIAIVPGTANTPVSIANVHGSVSGCPPVNGQYYNTNPAGNQFLQYDGYTDVFTAMAIVVPCQVYTIKLAISDVSDDVLDTGVFLDAKSFGSPSLEVKASTVSLDGTVTEGCSEGILSFQLPNPQLLPYTVSYNIIGTATNGVDYQTIPNNFTIPPGDTSISFPIIAFDDGIGEIPESIGIDVQRDPCNRDTFWIFIRDNNILPPNLQDSVALCSGTPVTLDATLPVPLPLPPTFNNLNDFPIKTINQNSPPGTMPTESLINVFGVQPTTLADGVIQSVCVNIQHAWLDDLDLYLVSPGGQFLELATDVGAAGDNFTQTCFTPTATTLITYITPPATGAPYTGEFLPEGVWNDLWDGDHPTNGTWKLIVIDDSNGFNGTLLDWTITFNPTYRVNYNWSPTGGLSCSDCPITSADPHASTTYRVVATDSYGCTTSDSIRINVNSLLAAPTVVCQDITANSITFSWEAVPGATNYEVSVDNGAWQSVGNNLTHVINGLSLNQNVNIRVRGIGNCGGQITIADCQTPSCSPPNVSLATATPTTCPSGADGIITLTGNSMNPPLVYTLGAISNQTGFFDNLTENIYTITYVDGLNCQGSIQVSISSPPSFVLQDTVLQIVSCFGGNNARAAIITSGATAPYSFHWSNSQNDSIATNLSAGIYDITITDANNCTATESVNIIENPQLTVLLSQDSVDCHGNSTGMANAVVSGGVANYTYSWSDANNQVMASAIDLPAGQYTVTVTDSYNCTTTDIITVLEPAALLASLTQTSPSCFNTSDGQTNITVQGGVAPYLYFWENAQTSSMALNVGAGVFSVTVSDAKSCVLIDSVTVTAPSAIVSNYSVSDAACFGLANGSIDLTANGGTGNLTYLWSNANTTQDIANVLAGTYYISITDDNNCRLIDTIVVNSPSDINTTLINSDSISCSSNADGLIEISVSGGTPNYAITWSGPLGFTASTPLINNLVNSGTYTAIIVDDNNCRDTITESIYTIGEPRLVNGLTTDIACKNNNTGSISFDATGGSAPYTFSWTGPNGFMANTSAINNLYAGLYTCSVTDIYGCLFFETVEITEPQQGIVSTVTATDTVCFGGTNGTAMAQVSGGTGPYSFVWSNTQTTATANNLSAGQYTVTITDNNQCTFVDNATIASKQQINVSLSQNGATCFNGTDGKALITQIQYGNAPTATSNFTIHWNTTPPQFGNQANNLTGGQTYSVVVTDNLGCTATQAITINNPEPNTATIDALRDVTCFGGSDGTATATPLGGTPPYTYRWSNNQQTATAANLSIGTYSVTITDDNQCTITTSTTIQQPPLIILDFTEVSVLCKGGNNGEASVDVSGGVAPYQYTWSNGKTTTSINSLAAGYYVVTITDNVGCTMPDSIEVVEPASLPIADFTTTDLTCYQSNDGTIVLTPTGGTPPYTYQVDNEPFAGYYHFLQLEGGEHPFTLRDANGCLFTDTAYVVEPPPLELWVGRDTLIHYGESISLVPSLNNGFLPLRYVWSEELQNSLSCYDCFSPTAQPTSSTFYSLTVTDAHGCAVSDLLNVIVAKNNQLHVPTGFTPNGDGNNDVLIVHGTEGTQVKSFQIYDRWGELVFENKDFEVNREISGWNGNFKGKLLPTDTYIWLVEVVYPDGFEERKNGETNLLR